MKTFFKPVARLCLLFVALTFVGCQSDTVDEPVMNDENTLMASSATAKLIERTVSNDGSFDNIVDGSSCFDIQFPYTVTVSGIDITINSESDLSLIEKLFDAVDDDTDLLEILFPITVVLADYSEVTIDGVSDLRELASQCVEGGDDADIECIDFVYPITLFTFDTRSQQTGSIAVSSDKELRRFFAGLGPNDLIGVDFPITFELHDGSKLTVDDYVALADAIENVKNSCDEDDDSDYNDDDFTEERLDALLVECPWVLQSILRENQDWISDFRENVLTFNEDGTTTIEHGGAIFSGSWETMITDWRVALKLEFEGMTDLNLEWFVYEIDEGKIKLFTDDANKVVLEKNCEYTKPCDDESITANLSECIWIVANGGDSFLSELTIDFSNFNIHVYNPNDVAVDEGNWSLEEGVLSFNDLSMELANYIGEWRITSCTDDRLEIKRGEELLVLERDCDN
ncbi:hypothetical protein [Maribacter sp. 2-571]|uniref:hypothetical protein n=1 Tax=Maribacter sp. 2-571 TaxID=3417569 RepID=UPI003D34DD2A